MRRKCGSGDARRCRWRGALLQVCCVWRIAFFDPHRGHRLTGKNIGILCTVDRTKNYEDETHQPSTGGTDGGVGC